MLGDLVQTTTRDGIRLDGALHSPGLGRRPTLGLDAICFVHGTGSNFYSSTLFDALAERLLEAGCAVLRVNTRGHDGISTALTARGGRRLGAAYEVVDDCRLDLAAWLDYLKGRAGPRLGLLGHSLGAVKCLYALAYEPGLPASCVVAVSPPRLSYSWFCSSPEGTAFRETYGLAERYVKGGEGGRLMEVSLPLPCAISAGGYVEKYGPDERYNFLRFLHAVPCPTLITYGGREVQESMAFRRGPEEAEALAARHGRLRVVTIPGADHVYSTARDELVARVAEWLATGTGDAESSGRNRP